MIETKHAALDTLSVTIQALHVSGKQMTLAVFRQLPRIKDINAEHELWGIVRYSIKDEGDVWLVLSISGVLYRKRIPTQPPDGIEWAEKNLADARAQRGKWDAGGTAPEWVETQIRIALSEHERVSTAYASAVREYETGKEYINNLPQLYIAV